MAYKHKRSSTAGNIPAAGVLQPGEIAVNFADKSIYTEDTGGNVIELARDVYKASPAPTSPSAGDIWYDTANNVAKIWNSSAWASLGGGATLTEGDTAAQAALTGMKDGDIFYVTGDATASENDRTYVYSTTSSQWIEITGQPLSSLDFRYVQRAGDVMVAGATIQLGADPVNSMDAVTLQYLKNNSAQVTVATSAPLSPGVGDLWVDNTTSPAPTYVWDGSNWTALGGTSATISDFAEAVQDAVGGFTYAGNNVTVSYNDANNSLTVSSKNSTLAASAPATAQDGDIWFDTSNNQLSYYDAGWQPLKIDAANVVFASSSGLTSTNVKAALDELNTSLNGLPETIQDTIGSALVAGNNVSIVYNDPAGTITISSTNDVKSVNGILPDVAGNVTITMGKVYSGDLASLGAGASAAAIEGDNYVVQGDATPANNGKMFIYDGTSWLEVGMVPPPKVYIGPTSTPPATPWSVGDLWWNSDQGVLLVYYDDGSSSQWVPATPSSLASTGATYAIVNQGSGAPTISAVTNSGQIYIDTATNEVYYSDGTNWIKTAGGGAGLTFTNATSAPVLPKLGDEWYDTTNDILYIRSSDGSSEFWLDVSSAPSSFSDVTIANTITISSVSANGSIGTAGQALYSDGTNVYWGSASGSKWTDVGSDIYRNSNVAVGGTSAPAAKFDLQAGSAAQAVVAMTALDMDLSLGQMFTKTAAAGTYSFSNVPAGRGVVVVLHLENGGAVAITWPGSVKWPGGTAPTLTAAGTDVLTFVTHDGGTTWRGNVFGKDIK